MEWPTIGTSSRRPPASTTSIFLDLVVVLALFARWGVPVGS